MPESPISHTLLPAAVAVAGDAGEAVMQFYCDGAWATTYKESGSPVTCADTAAHNLIVERLSKLTPSVPVLSEESQAVPYTTRQAWSVFWLVDPLDGTKEFIKHNGEFTVNIALIEDGRPVLGVVHAPAMNVTYVAADGLGAFKQSRENGKTRISVGHTGSAPLKVVVSRSHASDRVKRFLDSIGAFECIDMGSSLKICAVAEGAADLYPRLGPTMEWDTAAAQCVVENAGGTIIDLDGRTLRYNKPNLLNPDFIVSASPGLAWQKYLADEPADLNKPAN